MPSGHPTANFSDSDQGLFSPDEIQRLMRIEYQRSLRYEYPISLMLVEVDRLEYLHDLYGLESREEILQAVVAQLRSITRASDFLGCMNNDRLMALFPHSEDRAAAAIAGRLLRNCRELSFESNGRTLRITLSAGLASVTPGREVDFDKFVESAEEGLRFASECGGDRYVRREAAADMIEELRAELEAEARMLREEHVSIAAPIPVIEDLPTRSVGDRIRELFRALPDRSEELAKLEEDVVLFAQESVRLAREHAVAEKVGEHAVQVDVLERRVTKLKELLDTTEDELLRVAALKGVDSGIASVYRSVQGLSEDEEDFDRKKEVLTILFEANVELRKKIRGES